MAESKKLSNIQALNEILGRRKILWDQHTKNHYIMKRGVLYDNRELHSHKWTENGITYDFCLKCGLPKETEKYWSHGCPVPTKQYNAFPIARHDYVEIKYTITPPKYWRKVGSGSSGLAYVHVQDDSYEVSLKVCRKCGIIPEREKIFYKLDKESKKAYEVSSPVGAKKRHISCAYTDDQFDVREILL